MLFQRKPLIEEIKEYLNAHYQSRDRKPSPMSRYKFVYLPKERECYEYENVIVDVGNFLKKETSDLAFSRKLNQYMHERDITTAMIYKRCFVDRKLISKITVNENYHPAKQTVLALCIALTLNLEESEEFMSLAGYAFNQSSRYDLIIKFFIKRQIYQIDTINDILHEFGEPCFGE